MDDRLGEQRLTEGTSEDKNKRWMEMADDHIDHLIQCGVLLASFEKARRQEEGIWTLGSVHNE